MNILEILRFMPKIMKKSKKSLNMNIYMKSNQILD